MIGNLQLNQKVAGGGFFRDNKTSGEWEDQEENADSETIAVELQERNAHDAESVDQERGEGSEEEISILNGPLMNGAFYTEINSVNRKKINE